VERAVSSGFVRGRSLGVVERSGAARAIDTETAFDLNISERLDDIRNQIGVQVVEKPVVRLVETAEVTTVNRVSEMIAKAETKLSPAELTRLKRETEGKRRAEARLKGYEGDACGSCGNFTLVRNGTCMKCDTCGSTSGCS
jgi:ribonucleoside-diphosphate reductase alpha chain